MVTALIKAGLVIERLEEYPYANGWRGFDDMRELDGHRLAPPPSMPRLPMMYAVTAGKA